MTSFVRFFLKSHHNGTVRNFELHELRLVLFHSSARVALQELEPFLDFVFDDLPFCICDPAFCRFVI